MNALGLFISQPLLALLPAVVLTVLYFKRRRQSVMLAALAWFAYFPYELAMKMRLLCTGECNIRIDLLLIYPVLAIISVIAIVTYAKAKTKSIADD